jgi:hypothetical protein
MRAAPRLGWDRTVSFVSAATVRMPVDREQPVVAAGPLGLVDRRALRRQHDRRPGAHAVATQAGALGFLVGALLLIEQADRQDAGALPRRALRLSPR